MKCPLCSNSKLDKNVFYQKLHNRDFHHCGECDLYFVDREQILTPEVEITRYRNHNNDKRTEGYDNFLRRLVTPVQGQFSVESDGLDFGCGPYPMLVEIFQEENYKNVKGYDPFYKRDDELLRKRYDFITMCEVIEHVSSMSETFSDLLKMLQKGSWLIISTCLKKENTSFDSWYYILDDTHINFLTESTVEWICSKYNFELIKIEKDLIILSKK